MISARIECSAKTLKELGLHKEPVSYGTPGVEPFFSWYAHLFHLDRKKCLLFVNCLTRYPVVALYLSRKEIRYLNAILGESLKPQLAREGVPDGTTMKFLEHLYRPEITKSNNRSIIGTAVDYQRQLFSQLDNPHWTDKLQTQTDISLLLARTPILVMKEDSFPYSVFKKQLAERYGETGNFPRAPFESQLRVLH